MSLKSNETGECIKEICVISVNFEIPMFNVTHLSVQYLKIANQTG